jgi:ABC-type Mn2+/Zn2+ transport system ATPase subunit
MMDPLFRLRGVSCWHGRQVVLDDIDMTILPASFTGVVGPSGAGKTTLLRVLTGSHPAAAGSIERRPGVRVAYVPQVETVNWSFPVTVAECVLMGRARDGRRLPWRSAAERAQVDDVLARLGIGGLGRRHIRELSGGQQQRMFLARALLQRPDLLLLDEPTSGVDVRTRHEVLHLLDDLNQEGIAVLLTTHDLNGIAAHLPYLVCLNTRVIGAGSPAAVLTSEVLEATYGARLEILEHAGMPVVVDQYGGQVLPFRRRVAS